MKIINIINPDLENQRFTGGLIESGCASLGWRCHTTSEQALAIAENRDPDAIAVIHGPNYAHANATGRVIWLDRCWYGSTREWISLGFKLGFSRRWFATGDGSRFGAHVAAGHVELAPMREPGGFTIALDDFDRTLSRLALSADIWREHPAHRNTAQGLRAHEHTDLKIALEGCSKAICGAGTCAAQAALLGLEIECRDEWNEGFFAAETRQRWAEQLAWRQFKNEELANGFALELLLIQSERIKEA